MLASDIKKEARNALRGKWGTAICIILVSLALSYIGNLVTKLSVFYLIIDIPLTFGLTASFIKLKRDKKVSTSDFLKDGFANFCKSWEICFLTLKKLTLPIICIILTIIILNIIIGYTYSPVIMHLPNSSKPSILINIILILLPLATLIYGYSKFLLYSLSYYIAYDNPELSSKECVLKSETLMKGNRINYLLLKFSFLGWFLPIILLSTFFTFYSFKSGPAFILPLLFTWLWFNRIFADIVSLWLSPYIRVATVFFYDRLAKPEVKIEDKEVKIEE